MKTIIQIDFDPKIPTSICLDINKYISNLLKDIYNNFLLEKEKKKIVINNKYLISSIDLGDKIIRYYADINIIMESSSLSKTEIKCFINVNIEKQKLV